MQKKYFGNNNNNIFATFFDGNVFNEKRFYVFIKIHIVIKNIDDKKLEILINISDIFDKFGVRSISMDEIAVHLKISKKTLYQLFKNKIDVVENVLMLRQWIFFNFNQTKEKIINQDALLRNFYIIIQHISYSVSQIQTINHYDIKKYYPELYDKYVKQIDEELKLFFEEFIEICINKELFRDCIDYKLRVFVLFRAFSTFNNPDYPTDNTYTLNQMIFGVFDCFINSVVTEKGLKEWNEIVKNPPKIDPKHFKFSSCFVKKPINKNNVN